MAMTMTLDQKSMSGLSAINAMKKFSFLFFVMVWIPLAIAKGGEPCKGYRGYVDFALGDAYNVNTAQKNSVNNVQLYSMFSTTHGYALYNWFIGGGVGYYYSFRDEENMFPLFAVGRYTLAKVKLNPYIESRVGIIYDPHWVSKIQEYGAISAGMNIYKGLQIGLRMSIFSRPSRYFTANAAVAVCYAIGK